VDIWVFIMLLFHGRSGRALWLAGAGAMTGLALLLETDSGIVLVAAVTLYALAWLYAARMHPDRNQADAHAVGQPFANALRAAAGAGCAALIVWLAGLAVASHGQLLSEPGRVLAAAISGVTNTSELGAGSRPLIEFVRPQDAQYLFIVMTTSLAVFGLMTYRLTTGRVDTLTCLAGTLALYTLGRLLVFAGRSMPAYLPLAGLPLAITVLLVAAHGYRETRAWIEEQPGAPDTVKLGVAGLPWIVLLTAGILLFDNPSFAKYPHVYQSSRAPRAEANVALPVRHGKIHGLPAFRRPLVAQFEAAVDVVTEFTEAGQDVAILDDMKTLVYLEVPTALPWDGGASPFYNVWWADQRVALADRLAEDGPEAVLMATKPSNVLYKDTFEAVQRVLQTNYRRDPTPAGGLAVWRRAGPP
jgi:hypothetical protein